jgi:hypothetical protein
MKLSPCGPLRHTGGVEIQLQSFLSLALGGGEWSGLALGTSPPMNTTSPQLNRELLEWATG